MPRYAFKDLYVPSFDRSGTQAVDALPRENFSLGYERVEFTYPDDEFDFILRGNDSDASDLDVERMDVKRSPMPPGDTQDQTDALGLETAEIDTSASIGIDDVFMI